MGHPCCPLLCVDCGPDGVDHDCPLLPVQGDQEVPQAPLQGGQQGRSGWRLEEVGEADGQLCPAVPGSRIIG